MAAPMIGLARRQRLSYHRNRRRRLTAAQVHYLADWHHRDRPSHHLFGLGIIESARTFIARRRRLIMSPDTAIVYCLS